jgi:hypothetical protein
MTRFAGDAPELVFEPSFKSIDERLTRALDRIRIHLDAAVGKKA